MDLADLREFGSQGVCNPPASNTFGVARSTLNLELRAIESGKYFAFSRQKNVSSLSGHHLSYSLVTAKFQYD